MFPLIAFVLAAFAYTWFFHFQIVRNHWSVDHGPGRRMYWLGLPGPTLAALAVSIQRGEAAEVLARLYVWPIGVQWWLLAALTVPMTYAAATGAHWLRAGDRPAGLFDRPDQGWRTLLTRQTAVVLSEEIGWRGYALPLLMGWFGSLGGTLILGLIWALWHLPMFRVPSSHQKGSFWRYALVVTSWSIVMTVLFAGSGGSVLPPMLFHASLNISHFAMQLPEGADLESTLIAGLLALLAVLLLPQPLFLIDG